MHPLKYGEDRLVAAQFYSPKALFLPVFDSVKINVAMVPKMTLTIIIFSNAF